MSIQSNTMLGLDNIFFLLKEGLLVEFWQKMCLKKVDFRCYDLTFSEAFVVKIVVHIHQ